MSEDELSEDGPFAATSASTAASSTLAPASTVRSERYGNTAKSRGRGRLIAVLFGGAVVLVIGAWVIWAGLDSSRSSVDAQDQAHVVVSATRVDVTFTVSADRGQATACVVEAQNEDHAVVGWKVVDIPASTQRDQEITTAVLTTEPAVTGLIYSCWLT
ncbi:DUF4307 domain-containing protein [Subtercola boreus]|uniref:Uncharacterized protein n=1 Tax=Subtercola boreus TaxID=120213 RepID=A0A3E0W968_9MICO|nr:DUF4307 domain-containing protein [Subtercola boreus]RFA20035.1 hypothetical protein B7R24_10680 [Subtercola boreus]RFA20164.1 hypothetical protein B7R23_10620 [Subtercola boreus]RFA26491.1 hypothetical protein B7R25_10745 [Subtercola boreus]